MKSIKRKKETGYMQMMMTMMMMVGPDAFEGVYHYLERNKYYFARIQTKSFKARCLIPP